MAAESEPVGRVTRCSTLMFSGAIRTASLGLPAFGACVKAAAEDGQVQIIGVIHDIRIEDDPLARQMAALDALPPEQLADAQRNRQAPVEFSAVTIGWMQSERFHGSLPPRPPFTLAPVHLLAPNEMRLIGQDLSFTRQLFFLEGVPGDALAAALLRFLVEAHPAGEQERFLLRAGRSIARTLSGDLPRLESVLRMLQQEP